MVLLSESWYSARHSVSTARKTPAKGPRKRLQDARRQIYREAIVDAAEGMFAEHGYEAAKVTAIAKAAGVSLATLYGVFPAKWDVFRAVQADRLAALMQQVGPRVLAASTPLSRFAEGLESYLRFHMEHPQFLRVQLREQVPWGLTDELRTPEQTRAWEAGLQMLIAAFADGVAQGVFVDVDPELAARTATAMSQVQLALWVDRGMEASPDEVAAQAMAQFRRSFVRSGQADQLSA